MQLADKLPEVPKQPQIKLIQEEKKVAMKDWPLVMIVDDDQMNIEVMKTMLLSQSVNSDTAMSGAEAL